MTREEAIRIIETVFKSEDTYKYNDSITHQALNMAIEALMREKQFMYNASQGTTTILKIGGRHFEVRERMI